MFDGTIFKAESVSSQQSLSKVNDIPSKFSKKVVYAVLVITCQLPWRVDKLCDVFTNVVLVHRH